MGYAEGTQEYPSKTWGAKAKVQCIKAIAEVPMDFYQVIARQLRAEGFDDELPAFEQALEVVQHYTTRGNRLRELDQGDRFAGKARGGRIL